MKGWTALQIRTLLLSFVLNMLDGADVLVVSFVAPVLTQEWQVSDALFGLVFGSGLAGMTVGALFLAPFSDVWGRKVTVLTSTVVIATGMLASAFAGNVAELSILRFWTGLGVGSMLASLAALSSEYAPSRFRSFAVIAATSGYPLGALVAGLAGAHIIPAFGWEGMFVLVGFGSVLVFPVLIFALPESVEFLFARQPRNALHRANTLLEAQNLPTAVTLPPPAERGSRPPISRLLDMEFRTATLLLWGAFFAAFLTLYFLTSWIPRIAVNAGYPLATAINGSALFNLGAFAGNQVLGWFTARYDLTKLIAGFFVLASTSMVVVGAYHAPQVVYYAGMVTIGFLLQGGFGGLYAMAAQQYPTAVRATGVGWGIGVGRLGAVAGPVLGGVALSAGLGLQANFAIFALPVILAAALVWALGDIAPTASNQRVTVQRDS